jgi:hypothetical protein
MSKRTKQAPPDVLASPAPPASSALDTVRGLIEEWKATALRATAAYAAADALDAEGAARAEVQAADAAAEAINCDATELEERICVIALATFGRSPQDVGQNSPGVALAIDGRLFLIRAGTKPGLWGCDVLPPEDYLVLE